MASLKDIIVRLRLQDSEYTKGIKTAQVSTESFGSRFKRLAATMMPPWLRVAAIVGSLGIAIRSAARSVNEWELAQARMELVAQGNIETLSRMRSIVDANSGGLFNKQSVAAAVNYAFSLGVAVEKIEELMPFARNLAAINNEDLGPSFEKIIRAVEIGNEKAGIAIGLRFDEIALEREATRAYREHYKTLDDLQKLEVRYAVAKEQLSRTIGGEIAALQTSGGAWKKLGIELGNLAETAIGPFVESSKGIIRELTDAVIDARLVLEPGKGDLGPLGGSTARRAALQAAYEAYLESLAKTPPLLFIGGQTQAAYDAARAWEAQHAAEAESRKKAEQAFQDWKTAFVETKEKERIAKEYEERYYREQIGRKNLNEIPSLRGAEPEIGLAGEDAIDILLRGAQERADLMHEIRLADAERERALNQDLYSGNLELAESYQAAMVSGWETMYSAMNQAGNLFWNRENRRGRALSSLARYVAKETAASVIEGLGMQAKEYAGVALAHAGYFAAQGNFASAAAMLANAAQWGTIAGTTAVAAGAIRGGAQRELAGMNYQTEPAAGEITRRAGGTTSISSRGDLAATISKAPENVYINVTTVFEGPNIVGGDEAALREFYDSHIQQWVAEDARAGTIAA